MLKIFKRDLFLCAAMTALVILCALAWGQPFVGSAIHAQAQKAQVFQGAVLRKGEQLLLRDTSGEEFFLDSGQEAQQYLGKDVILTGRLEDSSKALHVVRIEPAS